MKTTDKQTDSGITEGIKIASYTTDDNGEYIMQQNYGWQPMNIANRQAWQEIEKSITLSKKMIQDGKASCLHYYMTANQMNPSLLATYTNQRPWVVRLHLIPFVFSRLGLSTLKKYADLFQVSTSDLLGGILRPPIYNRK